MATTNPSSPLAMAATCVFPSRGRHRAPRVKTSESRPVASCKRQQQAASANTTAGRAGLNRVTIWHRTVYVRIFQRLENWVTVFRTLGVGPSPNWEQRLVYANAKLLVSSGSALPNVLQKTDKIGKGVGDMAQVS